MKGRFKDFLDNPEIKVNIGIDKKDTLIFGAGLLVGFFLSKAFQRAIIVIK